MLQNQSHLSALTAQRRMHFALLIVSLLILALSVQYSPLMGGELWWLLILSWLIIFLSVSLAVWRFGRDLTHLAQEADFYASEEHAAEGRAQFSPRRNTRASRVVVAAQVWLLILGILFTLVFASRNYWASLYEDQSVEACVEDAHI